MLLNGTYTASLTKRFSYNEWSAEKEKNPLFPLKSKIGDRIVIIPGVFLEYFFGLIKYLKVKRILVDQVWH